MYLVIADAFIVARLLLEAVLNFVGMGQKAR